MIGFNDKAHNIFNMINPINHTLAYLDCERFKVEPYVVTADVYAVEPHIGRGGWSWYTGAAGWMYTTAVTGILGLKLDENRGFRLKPNIPKGWNEFKMTYKRGKCVYKIDVKRDNEEYINLDGKRLDNDLIPFLTEGEHFVEVAINH